VPEDGLLGDGEPPHAYLTAVGRGYESAVRAEGLRGRGGQIGDLLARRGVPDEDVAALVGGHAAGADGEECGVGVADAGPLPVAGQLAVAGGVPQLGGPPGEADGGLVSVRAQRGHRRVLDRGLEQHAAVGDRAEPEPFALGVQHGAAVAGEVEVVGLQRRGSAGPAAGGGVPQPCPAVDGHGEDPAVSADVGGGARRESTGAGAAVAGDVPGGPGGPVGAEQDVAAGGEDAAGAVAGRGVGEGVRLRLGEGAEQGPAGLGQLGHLPGSDAEP
jgi:hypothetical protein